MTLISTLLILLLLCNMLIICSKNTKDLIKSYFFFNYIMYIQHNICSMNMKHCKKKRNPRGIMRLISNKNRSIAKIKRTRFSRFQVYRTIKRNLSIPLPPPFLPVELWNSIFVSIFFFTGYVGHFLITLHQLKRIHYCLMVIYNVILKIHTFFINVTTNIFKTMPILQRTRQDVLKPKRQKQPLNPTRRILPPRERRKPDFLWHNH